MRTDVYQKHHRSDRGELERGVRPWLKPWNAEQWRRAHHAALARRTAFPIRASTS